MFCLKTRGSNQFNQTIQATCEVDLNLSNILPFPLASASFIFSGEWTGKSSKRASPGHFRCHSNLVFIERLMPVIFHQKIARNPLTVTQTIGTQGHRSSVFPLMSQETSFVYFDRVLPWLFFGETKALFDSKFLRKMSSPKKNVHPIVEQKDLDFRRSLQKKQKILSQMMVVIFCDLPWYNP